MDLLVLGHMPGTWGFPSLEGQVLFAVFCGKVLKAQCDLTRTGECFKQAPPSVGPDIIRPLATVIAKVCLQRLSLRLNPRSWHAPKNQLSDGGFPCAQAPRHHKELKKRRDLLQQFLSLNPQTIPDYAYAGESHGACSDHRIEQSESS